MSKKTRPLFSNQRLNTPSTRKRLDAGILVAGFLVAFLFGVLTWINYQDRGSLARTSGSENNATHSK